jgi:hypothetical protein
MNQNFLRIRAIPWLLTVCTHGALYLQAQDTIPFLQNRPSCLPIVQLRLNGQIAFFLLDTGSEITIINSSVRNRFNFLVKESSGESDNIDWSGNSIEVKDVLSATLQVGSAIITTGLRTADLDLLLRQVGSRTRVNVVGILGSDILRRAALVVDYAHNMLRH